jgi:glycosyltransferase involved in cell wall biosynthesis
MDMPLFSIIMPIYNTEKYLENAVESILSQKFCDFELLLINDGSIDTCPEIIDAYAKREPRIRAFHKPNGGTYTGYNLGIEQAKGKYMIFIASDDLFDSQALEIVAAQALEYDYDVIFMNVVSHSCDEEQNIIHQNIQGSIMENSFKVIGKKEVEKNWLMFMSAGLVRNPVNAYKSSIIKKHSFRTDVYGADLLMNIALADEIQSASCHPANLYHTFFYTSIKRLDLNASTGKYQHYEHSMFNEFYEQYKDLFESWNLLDNEHMLVLSNLRIALLDTELVNIFAWNNEMSFLENVLLIISYYDEVVAEAAAFHDKRSVVEGKLLSACYKQIQSADKTRLGEKGGSIVDMINAMVSDIQPWQDRLEKIITGLFDSSNPFRIGLFNCINLCQKHSYLEHRETIKYLIAEANAWDNILINKYIIAADFVVELFKLPFVTPEKYILLALVCKHNGNDGEAKNAIALGQKTFPDDMRLNSYAEILFDNAQMKA